MKEGRTIEREGCKKRENVKGTFSLSSSSGGGTFQPSSTSLVPATTSIRFHTYSEEVVDVICCVCQFVFFCFSSYFLCVSSSPKIRRSKFLLCEINKLYDDFVCVTHTNC